MTAAIDQDGQDFLENIEKQNDEGEYPDRHEQGDQNLSRYVIMQCFQTS
jgi:hypothetical protein